MASVSDRPRRNWLEGHENCRLDLATGHLRGYSLDLVPTIEDIQSKLHLLGDGVSVVSHYMYIIHRLGYQQKVAEGVHAKVRDEYQRRGYPQALVPTIEKVQSLLCYFDDEVSIVNLYLYPYSYERVVKEIIPLVECEFGRTGLEVPDIDPLWVREVLLNVKGRKDDCIWMCVCIMVNEAGYSVADFEDELPEDKIRKLAEEIKAYTQLDIVTAASSLSKDNPGLPIHFILQKYLETKDPNRMKVCASEEEMEEVSQQIQVYHYILCLLHTYLIFVS